MNHYETGGVPPAQPYSQARDVVNKCEQCSNTWIGSRARLCDSCCKALAEQVKKLPAY
jgi:hypothetical protein